MWTHAHFEVLDVDQETSALIQTSESKESHLIIFRDRDNNNIMLKLYADSTWEEVQ